MGRERERKRERELGDRKMGRFETVGEWTERERERVRG